MVQIFAGVDPFGDLLFISEVPSGLACGCFCTVCGARLIARKGEINDPHFAHEGGQQRPECLVGARNLVRRIVCDYLKVHPFPEAHRYAATVTYGDFSDRASWSMKVTGVREWRERPGPDSPAAILELERGYQAELVIVTSDEEPVFHSSDPDIGRLLLRAPMPSPLALRAKENIAPYLIANMQLAWAYLPDAYGVIESAKSALQQKQRTADEHSRQYQLERQRLAGMRWAKVRGALQSGGRDDAHGVSPPVAMARPSEHMAPPAALQAPQAPQPDQPWACGHVPQSAVFCFLLRDGTQWVLIRDAVRGHVLRPYPVAEDGWDEAFPGKVGRADLDAGGYLVESLAAFLGVFSPYFRSMSNTSALNEVAVVFKGFELAARPR